MKEKKSKTLKYDAETMQKYLNECTVDAYEKGLQVGYERGKTEERKKTLEEVRLTDEETDCLGRFERLAHDHFPRSRDWLILKEIRERYMRKPNLDIKKASI